MKKISVSLIVVLLFLCICPEIFAQPNTETRNVRIGIMPDVDSLPFMLADSRQLFTQEGAGVDLVQFQSPIERDAAFQAGQVDGIVGDTLGALFLEQAGFDISILSKTNGRYGLAGEPKGTVTTLQQLGNQEIGVSSNTIIEYIADSLVGSAGIEEDQFKTLAVPKIPVRMELLLNGQISSACLPEPLYSLVLSKGALALGDSTSLDDAPGVMIFSSKYVKDHKDVLTKVFKAYWKAGQLLNANPDDYRSFLVETAGFPPQVAKTFSFVAYTKPQVPTESQVRKVSSWMERKKLLDTIPSYGSLVDDSVVQGI
ncbi:ABC transporter substrate-binding protein [uncultured Sphaerochaeta sp.]|uniref:ABC transporter substrate-binding protein n=1 Tax=uncultured Sphaerochaeta sp. TaxID=886478 RepID=UPI002A0A0F0F|nr:ABC transporter substrate-binding protein [uncultured Sphaerochaeta sp.]